MLVTSIVEENKVLFQDLIPRYLLEGLKEDNRFGIGLLDVNEKENTAQAVGAVVFDMLDGTNEEDEDLMTSLIRWFYIGEEYREQGAADMLMKEYLSVIKNSGQQYVMCDLPLAAEYDQLCSYLQTWDFEFGITDDYELIIQMKDFLNNIKLPEMSTAQIVPLCEIHASAFREYIQRLSERSEVDKHLSENSKVYDGKVSCCYTENGKIMGALLVKKVSDDYVEICSLEIQGEHQTELAKMMLYAKQQAEKRYSPDAYLNIVCSRTPVAKILSYFFPEREPLLVRRGVLDLNAENQEEEV